MAEPLFPIRSQAGAMPDAVLVIEPYRNGGAWVFDDPATGLVREPFVAGVTEMIDRLAADIPDAADGFRLLFAVRPFVGYQASLTWVRADPVEGNWYRADDSGEEGWLCLALFCYFPAPPPKIYVRAEPKQQESGQTSGMGVS
jgi:hypothetical protein